jgi:hypothetical protein
MEAKAKIIFLNSENVEDSSQSSGASKKRGLSIKKDADVFEISALAGGGQLTKVLQKFTGGDSGGSSVKERGEETSTKSTVLLATVSSVDVATVSFLTMTDSFLTVPETGSKLTLLRVGKDLVVMSGDMVLWRIGGFFEMGGFHGGLGLKSAAINKLIAKHVISEKALRDDLYALSDASVNGSSKDFRIESKDFEQLILELKGFIQHRSGYGFFTPNIIYGNGVIRGVVDYSNVPGLGHVVVDLANNVGYKYDLFGNFAGVDNLRSIVDVIGSRGNDIMHGNDVGNFLIGFTGSDTFIGSGGDDYIQGGTGGVNVAAYTSPVANVTSDVHHITANLTAQVVSKYDAGGGQIGVDTLSNIQEIIGGVGDDYFIMGSAFPGVIAIDGMAGVNTLGATGVLNSLIFNFNSNAVSVGVTQVLAFTNIQLFIGGSGDDTFVASADESLTVDGGLGNNTLDYSQNSSILSVTVDLSNHEVIKDSSLPGSIVDHYSNMQGFIGSSGADSFIGGIGNHYLDGAGGVDILDYSKDPNISSVHADMNTGVVEINNLVTVTSGVSVVVEEALGGTDLVKDFQTVIGASAGDNVFAAPNGGFIEFIGGSGNDTFIGNAGLGVFVGAGGTNLVDYSGLDGGNHVTIDFNEGIARVYDSFNNLIGVDIFSDIQIARGSSNNDVVIGGPSSLTVDGQTGFNQMSYDSIVGVDHVVVNVAANTVEKYSSSNLLTGTDSLVGVQKTSGTAGADTFLLNTTTGTINKIDGIGGLDTLNAAALAGLVLIFDLVNGEVIDHGSSSVLMSFQDIEHFIGNDVESIFVGALSGDHIFEGGSSAGALQYNIIEYGQDASIKFAIVDLANGFAEKYDNVSGGISHLQGTDTLINIRNVVARSGHELIIGDSNDNGIVLANGDFTVEGSMGDDTINNEGNAHVFLDYSKLPSIINLWSINFATGIVSKEDFVLGHILGQDTLIGDIEYVKGSSGVLNFFNMTTGDFTIAGAGSYNIATYSQIPSLDHITIDLSSGMAQKFDSGNGDLGTDVLSNINILQLDLARALVIGDDNNNAINDISGVLSVVGSLGNDTISSGNDNVAAVDYSGSSVNASIDHITVDLSGTSSVLKYSDHNALLGADTLMGVTSFHGATGNDTFLVTNNSPYNEIVVDGAGGTANVLDFSSINFGIDVVLGNNYSAGTYDLSTAAGGTFQNFQTFKGGTGSTNFVDAMGNYTFLGDSNGLTNIQMNNTSIAYSTIDLSLETAEKFDANQSLIGTDKFIGVNNVEVYNGAVAQNYVKGNFSDNIISGVNASFVASAGDDTYYGNYQNITIDYSAANNVQGISVDLSGALISKNGISGSIGTDTLHELNTVLGTQGADTLYTGTTDNTDINLMRFVGNGGNDILDATAYNATTLSATFNLSNGHMNVADGRDVYFSDIFTIYASSSAINQFWGFDGNFYLNGGGYSMLQYDHFSVVDHVTISVDGGTVDKFSQNGTSAGIDTIAGFDHFTGANGAGTNIFYGGAQNVEFDGRGSSNIADYSSSTLVNSISYTSGTGGEGYMKDTGGTDVLSNVQAIRGAIGDDTLAPGSMSIHTFLGSMGNDIMTGSTLINSNYVVDYSGNANIDFINYSGTADPNSSATVTKNPGLNSFTDSIKGFDTIIGTLGDDIFNVSATGSGFINTFLGTGGNDTMNLRALGQELDMNTVNLNNISTIDMQNISQKVDIYASNVINDLGSNHALTIIGTFANSSVDFSKDQGWSYAGTLAGGFDIYHKTVGSDTALAHVQHNLNVIL